MKVTIMLTMVVANMMNSTFMVFSVICSDVLIAWWSMLLNDQVAPMLADFDSIFELKTNDLFFKF